MGNHIKFGNLNSSGTPFTFTEWDDYYPSAYQIEQSMWMLDGLANQHGWTTFDSGNPLIRDGGFRWERNNGAVDEEFVPESGGGNLVGYPWNTTPFWKRYLDVQTFVNERTFLMDTKGYWESGTDYTPHLYYTKASVFDLGNLAPIGHQERVIFDAVSPLEENRDVIRIGEPGKIDGDFFADSQIQNYNRNGPTENPATPFMKFSSFEVTRSSYSGVSTFDLTGNSFYDQANIDDVIEGARSKFAAASMTTSFIAPRVGLPAFGSIFPKSSINKYSKFFSVLQPGLPSQPFPTLRMGSEISYSFAYSVFPLSLSSVGVSSGDVYSIRSIMGTESGVLSNSPLYIYDLAKSFVIGTPSFGSGYYDIVSEFDSHKLVWGVVSTTDRMQFNNTSFYLTHSGTSDNLGTNYELTNNIITKLVNEDYIELNSNDITIDRKQFFFGDSVQLGGGSFSASPENLGKISNMLNAVSGEPLLFIAEFVSPFDFTIPEVFVATSEVSGVEKRNDYTKVRGYESEGQNTNNGTTDVRGSKVNYSILNGDWYFGINPDVFGALMTTSGNFDIKG